jgi:hypothetical protein
MNILEQLISETAKNNNTFAKMVGVTPSKLALQIKSKNPLIPAIEYAKLLKVKLEFEDNGCKVELDYSKE